MVRAESSSFKVGKKTLLQPTSIHFEAGRFHVVMGANGAGKSTLLKLLAGDQEPSTGRVFLDDKELSAYSKKRLALKRAVLSQHYHLQFPISVREVVLMGRYPHYGTNPTEHDHAICTNALRLMEMEDFANRDYTTLSGGEAQKVQMSRVLAQIRNEGEKERTVLFLDEPVSHLDVKYQYQLLRVAKALCQNGTTVVAILHDINLALSFADNIVLMKEGEIRHCLHTATELTPEMIRETFGVSASIVQTEGHKKPIVIF
jgi:iron complex transport system ATP-binding protein